MLNLFILFVCVCVCVCVFIRACGKVRTENVQGPAHGVSEGTNRNGDGDCRRRRHPSWDGRNARYSSPSSAMKRFEIGWRDGRGVGGGWAEKVGAGGWFGLKGGGPKKETKRAQRRARTR